MRKQLKIFLLTMTVSLSSLSILTLPAVNLITL